MRHKNGLFFLIILFLIILFPVLVKSLPQLVTHIIHRTLRIDDPDTWSICHEDRIHLYVDDHINPEDATAVFRIFSY